MQLTISLEISRYVNLRPFMQVSRETASGIAFRPPFNNLDLRLNLSTNLKTAINRSLKEEKPELWQSIEQLFRARQQVAHGKKAAFIIVENGPLVSADSNYFFRWAIAVRNTNAWLIELKNTAHAV